MRLSPVVAAAVLAAAVPAFAQPASSPAPQGDAADYDRQVAALFASGGLTADEVGRRARTASPAGQRRAAEARAAATQVASVRLANVPQVSAKARYTRLSDIDQKPLMPLPGVMFAFPPPILNNYSIGAELAVPVSDYLLRFPHLAAAARASERAAILGQHAAELAAASDAQGIYYEWVRARLQVVIAERGVAQIDRTLQQVANLVEVQRASRADLLRIQAKKAEVELQVTQVRELAAFREDQLRIAIGAGDEPLTIGEDVRVDVALPALAPAPELSEKALGRRFEARALDAALDAIGRQKRVARAAKLPRLDAFAQVNYDNPSQRAFPPSDEFTLTWAVGAQVSWKVNDFLGATPQLDAADAQASQLAADRLLFAQGVRLEVLRARQQVDIARQALITTAQGLVAAEEGYRVRKELLAAERATAIELLDAEDELTRARNAAIDARIDLRIALAKLRHVTGQDVD